MNKMTENSIIAILTTATMVVIIYLFTGDIIFAVCVSSPLGITLSIALHEQKRIGNFGFSISLRRTQAKTWFGFGLFVFLLLLMIVLKP